MLKAKHVRAAGAIAGVVLEQDLGMVVQQHAVSLGRRKATLAVLNDALKDSEVYDVPQWRRFSTLQTCGIFAPTAETTSPRPKMLRS